MMIRHLLCLLFVGLLLPAVNFAAGLSAIDPAADRSIQNSPATDPPDCVKTNSCEYNGTPVFSTFGVHNDPAYSPCPYKDCIAPRQKEAPEDPHYQKWWQSNWTMYRFTNKGLENNPDYVEGGPFSSPPVGEKGVDYTVSYGATYYDNTYQAKNSGGSGAMMERYDGFCLPLFNRNMNFSCSFVSLGDTAYFLTEKEDRPGDLSECCVFSYKNHPPRPDFIKHLPYSPIASERLNGVDAYPLWVPMPPVNWKVDPEKQDSDIHKQPAILFAYSYEREARADTSGGKPYRHPYAFYFSANPQPAPNSPVVTQNYRNFRATQPDPWLWEATEQRCAVAQPCPASLSPGG